MRNSTSCWRSNNNDEERLNEYISSRDEMNEVKSEKNHYKQRCGNDGL